MNDEEFALFHQPKDRRESLRDEADDFEDALRAEMIRAGVIEEW